MFMFDKKGQSSSVFNLLIAALVSLAILGLLLSIMGGIDFGGTSNPVETSIKILKNASQTNYSAYSDTITFSKKYPAISAKALAEKLDVGADKIIIKSCTEDSQLEGEGTSVNYTGSSDKKFSVKAICGTDSIDATDGVPADCSPPLTNPGYTCYLLISSFKG